MQHESNHSPSPDGAASLLVAAPERAWQTIRQNHPDGPDAVLVVASGSEGKRLNLGHFAPHRWQVNGSDRHEVLVGGEGLQRGPLEVLGTLLHEAAHGVAQARSIKDTSRQGRYHNRRYAALAAELGLEVTTVGPSAGAPRPRRSRPRPAKPASSRSSRPRWCCAPPRAPHRQRYPVPEPGGLHVPLRSQAPRRQGDPGRGADPLRRLPATLRARRPRRRQQLTLNRQPRKDQPCTLTCI
jgi:hypothetical protein